MQIKNLKVYNFGKLSDFSYDFTPGCNVICEDNGWGKTTLSSFIRAMFYGFAKKGPDASLRAKYIPWQGGTYGGELTFSDGEKSYTIIRTFGEKKTGRNDTFQLIDSNTKKKSSRYSDQIGQELFGINEDSFVNSAYVGQDGCEVSTTSDMTAKVGNQTAIIDDVKGFDLIQGKMDERIRKIDRTLKTKKSEKLELEKNIRRGPVLDDAISEMVEEKDAEKRNLEKKIENLRQIEEKQKLFSARQDSLAAKDTYHALEEQRKRRKKQLDQANAYFPGELPKLPDLKEMTLLSHSLPAEENAVRHYTLTEAEKTKLDRLDSFFAQGIPDTEELDQARTAHENVQDLKIEQARNELTREELAQIHACEERFADYLPSLSEIDGEIARWNQRKELISSMERGQERIENLQIQKEQYLSNRQQNVLNAQNNENSVHTMNLMKLNAKKQDKNNKIQASQIELSNLLREKDQLQCRLEEGEKQEKASGNQLGMILLACGILCLAGAFIMGFGSAAGIGCMAAGLVLALVGAILTIMKKQTYVTVNKESASEIKRRMEEVGRAIDRCQQSIQEEEEAMTFLEKEERELLDTHQQKLLDIAKDQTEPGANERMAQDQIEDHADKIREYQSEITAIEEHMKGFFEKTGMLYDRKTVVSDLQKLYSEVKGYLALRRKKEMGEQSQHGIEIKRNENIYKELLQRFFGNDFSDIDSMKLLDQLKQSKTVYETLAEKSSNYQQAVKNLGQTRKRLEDYIASLGMEVAPDIQQQLSDMQSALDKIASEEREYQNAEKEVKKFLDKYPNIEEILHTPVPDAIKGISSLDQLTKQMQAVNSEIHEINERLSDYEKNIQENSDRRAEIYKAEEALENLKVEIQELEEEKWLVSTTKGHMEEAKNSFAAKYMDPIAEAFYHYYSMIDPNLREEFVIDSDYNVQVNGGGEIRSVDVLSRGYQNLAGLCLRLGLLDAMYEKEEPFVILDDPFVNFDDGKYERAMEFLRQVSEKYQVIYLTCSKKRMTKI